MEKLIELAVKVQKTIPGFTLAGGTATMFKYNHRLSIDLDFFKDTEFSFNRLALKVRKNFNVENEERRADNLDMFISGIKVSFVFFPFKSMDKAQIVKGIKAQSDYDLFLNKIYVAGRRVDPKDPFDAAWLWSKNQWSVNEIKKDFEKKFPDQSYELYFGALLSFQDYGMLDDWVKEALLKLKP
jgi:hypothetical protein